MTKFAKRPDLIVELRAAGEQFLAFSRTDFSERDRQTDDNYRFCRLIPDETLRDVGQTVIADLVTVPARAQHVTLMNKPVFTWNGSIREPVVSGTSNDLVNTSECFPPSLTILATDYVDKGFGKGETIYDQFVKKIGALFFCEATPRDFQVVASRAGVEIAFRDPRQTDLKAHDHVAKGSLLYRLINEGGFPGFDIHDITHHASQIGLYGDFYKWLASHATEEVLDNPMTLRQKRVLRLSLLTTLEHSVVEAVDGVQSFGCLNWQSPRKSVLARGVSKGPDFNINDYTFGAQDFNQWSAIRAIASVYREQIEAEEVLSMKLNWVEALGYSMNRELFARVRPFQSYDYSDLTFDAARKATIKAPESPAALFENCRELIHAEFGSQR